MDYNLARAQAVHDSYAKSVQDFLDNYRPGAPTVVLLPGGMGSQLDRSPKAYHGEAMSYLDYTPVWLDSGLLFQGDVLTLEMNPEQHDIDDFILVPDGPLRFLVKAYDGTEKFFADRGANYIVFGFDWRRPFGEAVANLKQFLNLLRNAVFTKHQINVTETKTILLCHSQGGLVAKLFLDEVQDNVEKWVSNVITVATPFYGTVSHMQRYFSGEHILNLIHGAPRVSRIVGTLPGPYVLLPIGRAVWKRRRVKLGMSNTYPVEDETGKEIDPYDMANAKPSAHRYPAWVQGDYLNFARRMCDSFDLDLRAEAIGRVFNLRASRVKTPSRFRWRKIPATYDPGRDESPIEILGQTEADLRGDGTVPFYSARLAQTDDTQVYEIPTDAEHMDLMENARTLEAVWTIIQTGSRPAQAPAAKDEPYAGLTARSKAEVDAFVRDAADKKIVATDPRAQDPEMWRGVVRRMLQ